MKLESKIKTLFSLILLACCLMAMSACNSSDDSDSQDSYSNSSFSGVWLSVSQTPGEQNMYIVSTGNGNIDDIGVFNVDPSTIGYDVSSSGILSFSNFYEGVGQLTSSTAGTLSFPGDIDYDLVKVGDVAAMEGSWSGTFTESISPYNTYSVSIVVDSSGEITSMSGFTTSIEGKLYSVENNVVGFIHTAELSTDPYNQIQINATLVDDVTINGNFYIDNGSEVDGTLALAKVADSYTNATLSGTASGSIFRETPPDQDQTVSGYYIVTADGAGQVDTSGLYSMSSYDANQLESGTATYSMNTDGTFVVEDGYDYSYSTNPTGDFVIMTQVSNSAEGQAIGVFSKKGTGTYSAASLIGTYNYSYIGHVVGTPSDSHYSAFGTITFDGAGNFTQAGNYSELGGLSNTSYTDSGTYSVTASGDVSLENSDPSTFVGAINSKGDFLAMANTSEVNEQEILYLLKSPVSGFTNASLNGDYYVGRFSYQTTKTECCYGTFSFSGSSTYTASVVCSDSTGVTDSALTFGPYNYFVNDNGTFVVEDGGGASFSGAISPDGKTIVSSRINDAEKIDIMVSMKK